MIIQIAHLIFPILLVKEAKAQMPKLENNSMDLVNTLCL